MGRATAEKQLLFCYALRAAQVTRQRVGLRQAVYSSYRPAHDVTRLVGGSDRIGNYREIEHLMRACLSYLAKISSSCLVPGSSFFVPQEEESFNEARDSS